MVNDDRNYFMIYHNEIYVAGMGLVLAAPEFAWGTLRTSEPGRCQKVCFICLMLEPN